MADKIWLPVAHRQVQLTPELSAFNEAGVKIMNPHKKPRLELLRLFEMQALQETGAVIPDDLGEAIEANLPQTAGGVVVANLVDPEGLVVGYQGRGSKRYATLQLDNEYLVDERESILQVIQKETKTLHLPAIFDEHNMEIVAGRIIPGTGLKHNEIYEALDEATPKQAVLSKLKVH